MRDGDPPTQTGPAPAEGGGLKTEDGRRRVGNLEQPTLNIQRPPFKGGNGEGGVTQAQNNAAGRSMGIEDECEDDWKGAEKGC